MSAARAWYVAAAAGLGLFALQTLHGVSFGFDDFFDRYLYNGLILLALGACVYRASRPGRERSAWVALSIGVGCWAVAELIFDFVYGGSPPYPSVADGFYLAFYPPVYVGLMLLLRSRVSEFNRALWLDGATAALASAALGAAVLFEVVLRSTDGSAAVIVTNLAYPLGDILLLSAVIGVFVLTGWKVDRTWGLIGAGLAATALADAIFLFQTATSSYTEGTLLDALWPASLLLLAAASWQPETRAGATLEGRPLLLTPLVCGATGLAILTYDHFHSLNLVAVSLAGATIVAVILRTAMTFRENTLLLTLMREHATTDELTELGNRRSLVADLDRVLAAGGAVEPRLLVVYDLDGFKFYNDTFGHPAGDALLSRLAAALDRLAAPVGAAYRLGGDEFCVLVGVAPIEVDAFCEATVSALSEVGDGFAVSASYGAVNLPVEATTPGDALRLADQRLYLQKRERSGAHGPQAILLEALYERHPELRDHVEHVAWKRAAAIVSAKQSGADVPLEASEPPSAAAA
jgi:diguanylate cyclase (GGDEF)-like protein